MTNLKSNRRFETICIELTIRLTTIVYSDIIMVHTYLGGVVNEKFDCTNRKYYY